MVEERKTLWPWICALVVALPVLYVVSFGPACLAVSSDLISYDHLNLAYRPLVHLAFHGPDILQQSLSSYVRFWHGEEALLIAYILDNSTV